MNYFRIFKIIVLISSLGVNTFVVLLIVFSFFEYKSDAILKDVKEYNSLQLVDDVKFDHQSRALIYNEVKLAEEDRNDIFIMVAAFVDTDKAGVLEEYKSEEDQEWVQKEVFENWDEFSIVYNYNNTNKKTLFFVYPNRSESINNLFGESSVFK